jgi:hypothetical protein
MPNDNVIVNSEQNQGSPELGNTDTFSRIKLANIAQGIPGTTARWWLHESGQLQLTQPCR